MYMQSSTQNLNWKYSTFASFYFWDILLLNALREEKRKSSRQKINNKKKVGKNGWSGKKHWWKTLVGKEV